MSGWKLCTVQYLDVNYEAGGEQYYFKTKENLKEKDIVLCHTKNGLVVGKVVIPNLTLAILIESKHLYADVNFKALRVCEKYPTVNNIKRRNNIEDNELPF